MPAEASITAAVLGSGTMGAQIALSLALGGAQVRLWGRRAEALPEAIARVETALNFLIENDLVDEQDRPNVLARVVPQGNMETAASGADFIIEAVAEDLKIKQAVLKRAEELAGEAAILSSTTSALSATALQEELQTPERFCIAHYAQPAHLVDLVEVVPGTQTSESTTEFVTRLLADTGKMPVRCPDIPGFLWARIQHAVLREFASLVGQGLVTPEACDTILKRGYATRLPAMGAFEHADLAGLDLMNGEAAKTVWADLSNISNPTDTPVGRLFAEGHTGMKSGQGFYDWTVRDADAFKRNRDAEIVRRVKINRGETDQ